MKPYILILTTVPDMESGTILAERLVEDRLAACVNISAAVESLYWWEGKIQQEKEHTLLIKTKSALFPLVKQKILELHPYELPEIIALPIAEGHEEYLAWMGRETAD